MVINERETNIYKEFLERKEILDVALDDFLNGEGSYSQYALVLWQGQTITLNEFKMFVESYPASTDIEQIKYKALLKKELENVIRQIKDKVLAYCGNGDSILTKVSIARQGVVTVIVRGSDLPAIRQSGVNPRDINLDVLETLQNTIGARMAAIESKNSRRWHF